MNAASRQTNVVRRGEGLPVIMIHGHGVDHRFLLALDDALEEAGGLERIYLDLPGFGETPALGGEGGLPELVEWLGDAIDELVDGRKFAVVGNSLGGLLARDLQTQLPGQLIGIALIAPVVDAESDGRRLPEFTVVEKDEELVASLPEKDREAFTEMTARQIREVWERHEKWVKPGIEAADSEAMAKLEDRYFLPERPEAESAIFDGPALFVLGRQDDKVGYEDQFALLEHYPHATYAVLAGAGHNVHIDQPEAVRTLLHQWAMSLPRA